MRVKPVRQLTTMIGWILVLVFAVGVTAAGLAKQSETAQDQEFSGAWTGSYVDSNGAEGALKFAFRKDDKGEWRGTMTFTNQDGDHKLELKSLQVAAGKFKAKAEPEGAVAAIEGGLLRGRLEGTYSLKPAGGTETVESGSWKVVKDSVGKPAN